VKLAAHGISVDAADGWEIRITRRATDGHEPGSHRRPVLHAATVALPVVRGDFGGGVTSLLSAQDVFVSLFEHDPPACSKRLFADRGFPAVELADFAPNRLQRSIPGQTGGQWFFQAQAGPSPSTSSWVRTPVAPNSSTRSPRCCAP